MKLVKSLLLGSAAGLCAVSAGQAADLPARTAAPVEYVRVCTAYGAGYFYIPGTDTCLRVGGRVRFSYQYTSNRTNANSIAQAAAFGGSTLQSVNGQTSGFQALTFLNFDARTQTSYGTLRTFIRLLTSYSGGGYLTSTTAERAGTNLIATGIDTFRNAATTILIDKAFIQFAGFTAGRAGSFFDFYAHDLEHVATTSGSDIPSTNLLAYTATFGGGFSATISAEDPVLRRQPIYQNQVFATTGGGLNFGAGGTSFSSANNTALGTGNVGLTTVGGVFTTSVPLFNAAGQVVGVANLDTVQRNVVPDVVGALRYDAAWGAAQISAAMHEIQTGKYVNTQTLLGATGFLTATNTATATLSPSPTAGLPALNPTSVQGAGLVNGVNPVLRQPSAEYGFAVQGGLKINLPQLATGDVLWLQAAYSEGALNYVGPPSRLSGTYAPTNSLGRIGISVNDAYVDASGKLKLTEAWGVTGAFLHYFTPEVRGAVFGSYAEVSFGKSARSNGGPANLFTTGFLGATPGTTSIANTSLAFSSVLRDYSVSTVGANLIWSPVRDLDIGVEAVYQRVDLKSGRVLDASKGALGFNPTTGVPNKTVNFDDVFLTRVRVQRDF